MAQKRSLDGIQAKLDADVLYKRTSKRMALQIWQGYAAKHLTRSNNRSLPERLRLAHTLLLQFRGVYFSQNHSMPSISSEQWLVLHVLNDRVSSHWHIIG